MGCDIHICTEVQETIGGKLIWRTADHFKVNSYFGLYAEENEEYELVPIFRDRDYALFSALAGVRSYSNEVEQLSKPRGLPEDSSKYTASLSDRWGGDGHTHSHYTLQELYDYQDSNKSFQYSGMVSPEDAAALDTNTGTPNSWCQMTTQEDHVYRKWSVNEDVMECLVQALEIRAKKEHWIFHSDDRVPKDKAERTRIVFWFDN